MDACVGVPLRQAGYSILEVLVSSAIVVIISFALLTALQNQQKHKDTLQRNLEFDAIAAEIGLYLGHPDTCVPFLNEVRLHLPTDPRPLPYPLTGVQKISFPRLLFGGNELVTLGVQKNGLIPEIIEFDQIVQADPSPSGSKTRWILRFHFSVLKSGSNFGSDHRDKTWDVYIEADPNGQITQCANADLSEAAKCFKRGRTYDVAHFPTCY